VAFVAAVPITLAAKMALVTVSLYSSFYGRQSGPKWHSTPRKTHWFLCQEAYLIAELCLEPDCAKGQNQWSVNLSSGLYKARQSPAEGYCALDPTITLSQLLEPLADTTLDSY
jgi:hypothetical protein